MVRCLTTVTVNWATDAFELILSKNWLKLGAGLVARDEL